MKFTYNKKLLSGKPYLVQKSKGEYLFNDGKGNERDISTIIAQFEMVIRKGERQKVLAKVEGWLVDEPQIGYAEMETDVSLIDFTERRVFQRNKLRTELREKLAELKGETKWIN